MYNSARRKADEADDRGNYHFFTVRPSAEALGPLVPPPRIKAFCQF